MAKIRTSKLPPISLAQPHTRGSGTNPMIGALAGGITMKPVGPISPVGGAISANIVKPILPNVVINSNILVAQPATVFKGEILSNLIYSPRKKLRKDLKVPVSPIQNISDTQLFESPDGKKKYYLPRYKIAEEKVEGRSGSQKKFKLSLEQKGNGGLLTLYLEKYAAPELKDKLRGVEELPHQLNTISINYIMTSITIDSKKSSNRLERILFNEITFPNNQVKAVLKINTLDKVHEIFNAMTQSESKAVLALNRLVSVAVPI